MATTILASGRYTTKRRIGHGGMATVHLASDEKLGREVAVKVLAENLAGDRSARKRFMREAQLAAKLSHPNIVQIFDVGEEEDERPFIVMEYVDGRALSDLLSRRRRLKPKEALPLLSQVAAGLTHAHEKGLVHRDVKPANLLVRRDGRLKIADFGIARALEDARYTDTGMVLGTRDYMAPEQADGGKIGPATDVYALGVVAREMLGDPPPELEGVLTACTARDPRTRPSAAALEAEFVSRGTTARPTAIKETERAGRLGEKKTGVTERVFNAPRDPAARGRGLRLPSPRAAIALVVAALIIAGVVFAISADSGDDVNGSAEPSKSAAGDQSKEARAAGAVPRSEDPAEQARALSSWLRSQSR